MKFSANKTLILSLILLGLGIALLIAENSFYQYVDNKGFLHESMFMPLGILSIIVGILVLLLFIIKMVRRLLSNQ
jgi:protein-S-isoprenylcysteine O-methyltransferase Ste14